MPLKVLYIHHCPEFGGSSRSLLEAIKAFPRGTVEPHVVCPDGGTAEMFEAAGLPVVRARGIAVFDHGHVGHYRGLRWLILARELAHVLPTVRAIREARRRWPDIEVVHANEYALPFALWLAKRAFRVPAVVHVRTALATAAGPRRRRWLARWLQATSDARIAIDGDVAATLPEELAPEVIHNGWARPPASPELRGALKDELGIAPQATLVGCVGALLPNKGVYELVEAVRLCAERGHDLHAVLVGRDVRQLQGLRGWLIKTFGFSVEVRSQLEELAERYGIHDRVHFLGFREDVDNVYSQIDVLCFASHLEGAGRPVFEAAFSGVPSVVALSRPRGDTIVDGKTGLIVPPRDAPALADALERLHQEPEQRREMGKAACELAESAFDIERSAEKVLALYRKVRAEA